jgi:hypothetical protein
MPIPQWTGTSITSLDTVIAVVKCSYTGVYTLSLSSLVSRILFSFLDKGFVGTDEDSEVALPSRSVMLANNQCQIKAFIFPA